MEQIYDIVAPSLALLVTALVPFLIAAMTQWFRKMGIDIEAKHRDALQSALQNAAILAITRGRGLNPAVDYVKQSVPDAIGKFGLTDGKIMELLVPHVEKLEALGADSSATEKVLPSKK